MKALPFSADDLEFVAQNNSVFSGVIGFFNLDRPVVTIDSVTEPPLTVEQVSSNFFRLLGLPMALGVGESAAPGAVISYRFWQARFGGRSNVVGQILNINGRSYSVTGVAAARFFGLQLEVSPDIWLWTQSSPSATVPAFYSMIGRIKSTVTAEQARAAMEVLLSDRNRQALPGTPLQTRVTPAGQGFSDLREQYERPLLSLMAMVTLVLLITCANIGTLLVVRNNARTRDLTIRVTLGARRSRLITQLLVENAMLAAAGGALALLVAKWGVSTILAMLPSAPAPLQFQTDGRMLIFVAVVSLVSTFLFAWLLRGAPHKSISQPLKTGQGAT
jgi:ABC-type antimicrobial peptide transport system permease subunit